MRKPVKKEPGARSKTQQALNRQFFNQLNDTDVLAYLERMYPHKVVKVEGRVDEAACLIALGSHQVIVDIRKRIRNGTLAG